MARKKVDLRGRVFGLYKVVEEAPSKHSNRYYYCECQGCMSVNNVNANSLLRGTSKGCRKCLYKAKHIKAIERKAEQDKMQEDKANNRTAAMIQKGKNRRTIENSLELFQQPLQDMLTAYRIKSKAAAQCALKDIVKIFKSFEVGSEVVACD